MAAGIARPARSPISAMRPMTAHGWRGRRIVFMPNPTSSHAPFRDPDPPDRESERLVPDSS